MFKQGVEKQAFELYCDFYNDLDNFIEKLSLTSDKETLNFLYNMFKLKEDNVVAITLIKRAAFTKDWTLHKFKEPS